MTVGGPLPLEPEEQGRPLLPKGRGKVPNLAEERLGVKRGEGGNVIPAPRPLVHGDAGPKMGLDLTGVLRRVKGGDRPGNPKMSIEEARAFLDSLDEGVQCGADKGAALRMLQEFTSSDWFKKTSTKDASLSNHVSELQRNLTTDSPKPSREVSGPEAPSVAKTPSPQPQPLVDKGVLRELDPFVEDLSEREHGVAAEIGQRQIWAKVTDAGGVDFFERVNDAWKKLGSAGKDPHTGQLYPLSEGKEEKKVSAFSPAMIAPIKAISEKLAKLRVLKEEDASGKLARRQRLNMVRENPPESRALKAPEKDKARAAGSPAEFLFKNQEGVSLFIDGQWYWARCEKGGQEIQLFERQGDVWDERGVAIQDPQTGKLQLKGGAEGASPVKDARLKKCGEKLSTMFEIYGSLIKAMKGSQIDKAEAEKVARKIAIHWASRWGNYLMGEGVRVPNAPAGTLVWRQPSKGSPDRIPGLKVSGPEGDAWYSLDVMGQGGFKKAKRTIRISPDGNVDVLWVRFTKLKKGMEQIFREETETQKRFMLDLDAAEKRLSGEDLKGYRRFIARLYSFPSHVAQVGESEVIKKRLVSEQASGDLFTYIEGSEGSPPPSESERKARLPQALSFLYDTVRGLRYLHEAGFVHKDIKPENILVYADGSAKITDFGFVARKGKEAECCGTPGYAAPELFGDQLPVEDPSMDMFSFGVMLLQVYNPRVFDEMIALGEATMSGTSAQDKARATLSAIQKKLLNKRTEPWILISQLIDPNPRNRPTSAETEARMALLLDEVLPVPPPQS